MQSMSRSLYGAPAPHQIAGGEVPRITLYPSGNPKPHGAVVVLPGGGYAGRAPHEGAPIAGWLNSLGISAAVCDYRVSPNRHPVPLLDAQRAIRYVRARADELNLRPDKIGVLGFSAGGHLASTCATHFDAGRPDAQDPTERVSCRPDAVILCYAVVSLVEKMHQGSMHNLLGDAPTDELRRELSAELQVNAETMPHFLWHTAEDTGVPIGNSLRLAEALASAGAPVELHVFPRGAHGLGLAAETPGANQWPELCGRWLARLGFTG